MASIFDSVQRAASWLGDKLGGRSDNSAFWSVMPPACAGTGLNGIHEAKGIRLPFHGGYSVFLRPFGNTAVGIFCVPHTELPARLVPNVAPALLQANVEKLTFGQWGMLADDDGIGLYLHYRCPLEAISPSVLRFICEEMVEHVAKFDQFCRAQDI